MVNMDLPDDYDTYVHRKGRVGRKFKGTLTNFFDPDSASDKKLAIDLVVVSFPSAPTALTHLTTSNLGADEQQQEDGAQFHLCGGIRTEPLQMVSTSAQRSPLLFVCICLL